jgi:hypothetical protein
MRLKRYIDFIKESIDYNKPVSITTDFAYDEALSGYVGNTEEEKLVSLIHQFSDEIYNIKEPTVEVLDMNGPGGGWPEVKITFQSISDAEKALDWMWGSDDWMSYTGIANGLKEESERDAFDYLVSKGKSEYFEDVDFSEEFMNSLSEEDKNTLRSIKGLNKYNI